MQLRAALSLLAIFLIAGPTGSLADDDQKRTMEFKTKTVIPIEMHVGGCAAKLNLQYLQKGSEAEVEATLTNADCGASAGDYRLLVRYRDESGEVHTDEYEETWMRSDAEPLVISKLYTIGDDVDLVRVLSRGLSCHCVTTDTPSDLAIEKIPE